MSLVAREPRAPEGWLLAFWVPSPARQILLKKYGRPSGIEFGPVDVIKYAEAFGAKDNHKLFEMVSSSYSFAGPAGSAVNSMILPFSARNCMRPA